MRNRPALFHGEEVIVNPSFFSDQSYKDREDKDTYIVFVDGRRACPVPLIKGYFTGAADGWFGEVKKDDPHLIFPEENT